MKPRLTPPPLWLYHTYYRVATKYCAWIVEKYQLAPLRKRYKGRLVSVEKVLMTEQEYYDLHTD